MCCTQKEMAAAGQSTPTDRWFEVKVVPCCIPAAPLEPESRKEERKAGGFDTKIPCGKCGKGTLRLLRVVRYAEQHNNEELPFPLAEMNCPSCDSSTTYTVPVMLDLAQKNGVLMHVPEEEA